MFCYFCTHGTCHALGHALGHNAPFSQARQAWYRDICSFVQWRVFRLFLALLDYVSGAQELEIRLSVCGIDYLWSYCMDFFQVVASPGPYVQTKNWFFYEYFSSSLTWDPMAAKNSKRYCSLKSLLNLFKLFVKFLLSGPDKSTVLDF